jgi:hypothetical protein
MAKKWRRILLRFFPSPPIIFFKLPLYSCFRQFDYCVPWYGILISLAWGLLNFLKLLDCSFYQIWKFFKYFFCTPSSQTPLLCLLTKQFGNVLQIMDAWLIYCNLFSPLGKKAFLLICLQIHLHFPLQSQACY